jgi:hypothetical protein
MGERGAVHVGDLPRLIGHGVADFGESVPEVGDERAPAGVEVCLAGLIDQPAPLPAGDQRQALVELAVEDVTQRILVLGHAGDRAERGAGMSPGQGQNGRGKRG